MNNDLELVAEQFRKLPGIGVKTARRLAYFMLERPQSDVDAFIQTIRDARSKVVTVPLAITFPPRILVKFAMMIAGIILLSA